MKSLRWPLLAFNHLVLAFVTAASGLALGGPLPWMVLPGMLLGWLLSVSIPRAIDRWTLRRPILFPQFEVHPHHRWLFWCIGTLVLSIPGRNEAFATSLALTLLIAFSMVLAGRWLRARYAPQTPRLGDVCANCGFDRTRQLSETCSECGYTFMLIARAEDLWLQVWLMPPEQPHRFRLAGPGLTTCQRDPSRERIGYLVRAGHDVAVGVVLEPMEYLRNPRRGGRAYVVRLAGDPLQPDGHFEARPVDAPEAAWESADPAAFEWTAFPDVLERNREALDRI